MKTKNLFSLVFLFSFVAHADPWQSIPRADWNELIKNNPRIDDRAAQSPAWKQPYELMENLTDFDETVVTPIENTLCGDNANKSVLVVGPEGMSKSLVFARLAARADLIAEAQGNAAKSCYFRADVELNVTLIEADHKYVGDVRGYWQKKVVELVRDRNVVLYLPNLRHILGIGSHDGDETGIEVDLASSVESGALKVVAFLSESEYASLKNSRYRYLLNAFGSEVHLPPIEASTVAKLTGTYLKSVAPQAAFGDDLSKMLQAQVKRYLPVMAEPDRSLRVAQTLFNNEKTRFKGAAFAFTRAKVREAVLMTAGFPKWYIDGDWSRLKTLDQKIAETVVGQNNVRADLVRLAKIGFAGERQDERPRAAALLVGPTGIGKSYIAKQFAKAIDLKMTTFDMTAYTDPYSTSKFVKLVSDALTTTPNSVLFFEEIDKASREALDKLYFLLDEGVFYDENQQPLYAGGAFVLLSTNAAENLVLQQRDNPELPKLVNAELARMFRPSFLNRFDTVSIFRAFSGEEFRALAASMAKEKAKALKAANDWTLTIDPKALDFIAARGKSGTYGARPMKRLFDNVVEFGFSEFQLQVGPIPLEPTVIQITLVDAAKAEFEISAAGKSLRYNASLEINAGDR